MVEKSIRGEICHANNKYTKYYDRNKDSSYLMYWEDNNLQEWVTSQKLLPSFK